MRLKPAVASGTIRVTLRDVVLGGGKFKIPVGTGLWTPSYPIHNSKLNWGQDAHDYRPVSRHVRTASPVREKSASETTCGRCVSAPNSHRMPYSSRA